MALPYPLSIGNRFDSSSVELKINGKRYIGALRGNYEQTLEPGEVRGLSAQILGYTRGLQKCSGSFMMLREEFQDLTVDLATITLGILEAGMLATVTYSELPPGGGAAGLPLTTGTDTIVGLRFTGTRHSFSAGSADPISVEMPWVARYILVNGFSPLNALFKGIAASSAP